MTIFVTEVRIWVEFVVVIAIVSELSLVNVETKYRKRLIVSKCILRQDI